MAVMEGRSVPIDPEGYAVDVELGYVHSRYAAHAVGLQRTRSVMGVVQLLRDGVGRPCSLCYPPPEPDPVKPRRGRSMYPPVERDPIDAVTTDRDQDIGIHPDEEPVI